MALSSWVRRAAADDSLVTYQLHIVLARSQWIGIGRLGRFQFPAGRYLYTGSARRNLIARVRRHLAKQKTLRWHIDYLLAKPQARVTAVELFAQGECHCNQQVKGEHIVPGFGASDCRAGCGSHLKYLGLPETDNADFQ
jgi:Uri superfamily endonuclease